MAIGEGTASTNQAGHDHVARGVRVGFFTDPTVCIGCKACEVACKEWNDVPDDGAAWSGDSYDHTGALGASSWRHVKFLEVERAPAAVAAAGPDARGPDGHAPDADAPGPHAPGPDPPGAGEPGWLFLSDVCKHCENAGCLECCPTGAIVRTPVGSVLVQDDVCNGCGYCGVSCPFGVVDRRQPPLAGAGGAFKCTFCYDRQASGLVPACAKVCPTESIVYGPLDALRERAAARLEEVRGECPEAGLYDGRDGSVGELHAFFLLLGPPGDLGLPPRPEVPTVHLASAWRSAAMTAVASVLGTALAFLLW